MLQIVTTPAPFCYNLLLINTITSYLLFMASKVVRVSEEALSVASKYSTDLSTAILLMQAKLEERERQAFDMKALEKLVRNTVNDCLSDLNRGF